MPNVRYLNSRENPRRSSASTSTSRSKHEIGEEGGRGRHAASPWQIPWEGWKDILLRTYEQMNDDRLLAVAAGVVFYGLLALFPAITALVSSTPCSRKAVRSTNTWPHWVHFCPGEQWTSSEAKSTACLPRVTFKLGTAFLFSFLLAVWSANGGMKAVIDALNVAYEEKEERGILQA